MSSLRINFWKAEFSCEQVAKVTHQKVKSWRFYYYYYNYFYYYNFKLLLLLPNNFHNVRGIFIAVELSNIVLRIKATKKVFFSFSWHGLFYWHCCSKPCFKNLSFRWFSFFAIPVTSSGASLLYSNNTDWTGD